MVGLGHAVHTLWSSFDPSNPSLPQRPADCLGAGHLLILKLSLVGLDAHCDS